MTSTSGIWTDSLSSLEKFITYVNTCDPSIKSTFEASQEFIHFLDTAVILKEGHITMDLYNKPTDSHNYLLYLSAHPKRCKDNIPYCQYLRIRRICSELSDFDQHMKEMTKHFLNRGYPIDLLLQAL